MSASTANDQPPVVLPEAEWQSRQAAHDARVRQWTDPHQARAARGEKHPVYDFLFTYYSYRPAWLRRWHPGPGVALAGPAARTFLRWPEYQSQPDDLVRLNVRALPPHRAEFVRWVRSLLAVMQSRPAFFGCYGWHEWAMVYRLDPTEIRHQVCPLRYPPEVIAEIVERASICCSHFDAFRFFTPAAAPRNKLQPTREEVPRLEQRGCLHANMDLYKWAFKLAPYTPSELMADCFALAWEVRQLDMRASPYDVSGYGLTAVPVETAEGRIEYERLQRELATRAEPLRARLIELCDVLLRATQE